MCIVESRMGSFPMPGNKLFGGTVVASVWLNDDSDVREVMVLLLNESEPYFSVIETSLITGAVIRKTDHHNIVFAVEDYEGSGGDV